MAAGDKQKIIEHMKEQIYQLNQQLSISEDIKEKRILKRRLRQLQIEHLKYRNKLG